MGAIPISSTNNIMRRRYKPKPKRQVLPRYRVNDYIRLPVVLVIDDEGNNLGEMSNTEAVDLAKSRGLDLVEVSPNARPPVCKITNYGKFKYNQSKQLKQSKQKRTETKGIRIGIRTSEHDLDFKTKQAEKFLKKGNKAKIELILRGREKAHQDLAKENLRKFTERISVPFRTEEAIKKFPGGFNTIISPE